MITTAWLTARSRDRETGLFDWGAFVFAVAVTAGLITRAVLVARGLAVSQPGVPIGVLFFTASIPLLAAVGDLRMLLRGGISGTPRIARHLWRMCYGWFIATGSFFLGKQQFFPAFLRKPYLLFPLAVMPLLMLIYWLVRIKFSTRSFLARPEMPQPATH